MNTHHRDAQRFEALVGELVDENPFAVRAVLKILEIEYTEAVPTLAVTCAERPRMLVNLGFISKHCRTDAHVKAVICHEFLHVLLRHTEQFEASSPLDNLAFDAVINAIIHRELGAEYSDMMARYYAGETGVGRLLRPPSENFWSRSSPRDRGTARVWRNLYLGQLVADDIREVAADLARNGACLQPAGGYLGNHDPDQHEAIDGPLAEALDAVLKRMNGDGIWRAPKDRGVGADAYENVVTAAPEGVERWRRTTYALLRRYLSPDSRGAREWTPSGECRLPVLSPRDKRSFLRALWSPLMPDALWPVSQPKPTGTAQVYLDVSGSMNAEMPLIVQLLMRLGAQVRKPFWAFSDRVAPARIRSGQLVAETTGGTSMACVLEHLVETRPPCAVVITDGYIEKLDPALVRRAAATRLHALVTRDGNPKMLRAAGIPYTQLERLPQ